MRDVLRSPSSWSRWVAPLLGLSVLATGCGEEPSAGAGAASRAEPPSFCEQFVGEMERLVLDTQTTVDAAVAADDPFTSLLGLGAATASGIQDLASIYRRVADAAPPEVRDDLLVMAEAYETGLGEIGGASTGDGAALMNMFVGSLAANGSATRVSEYVETTCADEIAASPFGGDRR